MRTTLTLEPDVARMNMLPLFGFVRWATSARLFDRPLAVAEALAPIENWLSRPHVRFTLPDPEIAFDLVRELGAATNLTTDVQLAALAIEHQGEVHSSDADFGRFRRLPWIDSLR